MPKNLVDPGDSAAQVTASGGKVYVSYQTVHSTHRASFTVDERSGKVTDNQYPYLIASDVTIVCMFLVLAGKDLAADLVIDRYHDLR
jgi:hypothetical protein